MAVLVLAAGALWAPLQGARAADEKDSDSKAKGETKETADRIIVSGASGQLAGEAIAELLGRGVAMERLILVTRTPDKLSAYASRGADVRQGDFTKPDTLVTAFAGGKQLLLISTSSGDRVAQHSAAITAARRAGVRHIVYTSWINSGEDNPAGVTKDHHLTELAIQKSGVPFTILRNQLYSDGLVAQAAQAVASREIVTNGGRGKWAPVSRRDCAAAAAAVLTSPGHEERTYDITGPELISERDFAALVQQITGRLIRVVDVDDATYVASLVKAGVPEEFAKLDASFGLAKRSNFLNIKSDTLKILIGREPETVKSLLLANKAQLLAATPANR